MNIVYDYYVEVLTDETGMCIDCCVTDTTESGLDLDWVIEEIKNIQFDNKNSKILALIKANSERTSNMYGTEVEDSVEIRNEILLISDFKREKVFDALTCNSSDLPF